MIYGAIEAGGTKFVCAVGNEELTIIDRVHFPTTTPDETMAKVIEFFSQYKEDLAGIGVGSFGPINLQRDSPQYGLITSTPKIAWQNFDFVGTLKNSFDLPIAWTTDVNAAAYGEYQEGAAKGLSSLVYFTIGTGVGGGAIQGGRFIEGFSHPEMGHMLVRKHPKDSFAGNCPFHGDCLEGLVSGPAIEKRLGIKGDQLTADDEYWELAAFYLAQCAYNTTLMLSPDMIIFGGGVMKQKHLLDKTKKILVELMKDYVKMPELDAYLQTPHLGDNAGITGCLALAKEHVLHSI